MAGIVSTRKLEPVTNYSFVNNTADIENGTLLFKGDIVTGETQIYEGLVPTTATLKNKAYLVANPASSYDTSRSVNQNRQNYINVKGTPFRVYELAAERKFDISVDLINGTYDVGSYVTATNNSGKYTASTSAPSSTTYGFIGKITDIYEKGFFYPVGVGIELDTDSGTGIDGRISYATIEIIQNS